MGRLSTGRAVLDQVLSGGWPTGAVSEICGASSADRTDLLLRALAEAQRANPKQRVTYFTEGVELSLDQARSVDVDVRLLSVFRAIPPRRLPQIDPVVRERARGWLPESRYIVQNLIEDEVISTKSAERMFDAADEAGGGQKGAIFDFISVAVDTVSPSARHLLYAFAAMPSGSPPGNIQTPDMSDGEWIEPNLAAFNQLVHAGLLTKGKLGFRLAEHVYEYARPAAIARWPGLANPTPKRFRQLSHWLQNTIDDLALVAVARSIQEWREFSGAMFVVDDVQCSTGLEMLTQALQLEPDIPVLVANGRADPLPNEHVRSRVELRRVDGPSGPATQAAVVRDLGQECAPRLAEWVCSPT